MARRVVEEGLTLTEAAEAAGVSVRTAGKWARRYRAEGEAGLLDRSSAPTTVHNATPPDRIEAIAALRRLRLTGPEIAELLEMATSTVSAVLGRIGLGKLSRLEPAESIRRYERSRPGELIHIDVKKLGRIERGPGHRIVGRQGQRRNPTRTDGSGVRRKQVGWECVHVCVDDATRLAYVEVLPDEKASTAIGFLGRAVAFYRSHGDRSRATDDRQWLRISLRDPRPCLQAAGDQAHPHSALSAPDQRQRRALHPNDAARVGICRRLRQLA
jgi:hypothetical protein